MRKPMVAVLAMMLMVATGSLMGSLKPSSKHVVAKVVPRGTVSVMYDPKSIDGAILKHQLVEKADRGAFLASGINLKEYNTFVAPSDRKFKEQVVQRHVRYNLRC